MTIEFLAIWLLNREARIAIRFSEKQFIVTIEGKGFTAIDKRPCLEDAIHYAQIEFNSRSITGEL